MADCLLGPYIPPGGLPWSGVSSDGEHAYAYQHFDGIYVVDTADWAGTVSLLISRPSSFIHGLGVDTADRIWWTESLDFVNVDLYSAALNGTGITLEASGVGVTTPLFYDPIHDWFWYVEFNPTPGLWTLEKDGTKTWRYVAPSQSFDTRVWVTSDGAAWSFRNYGSSGLQLIDHRIIGGTTAHSGFGLPGFGAPTLVDCTLGLLGGRTIDHVALRFTSASPSVEILDCSMAGIGPAGWSIQTPDYSRVWYVGGNFSVRLIYERACEEPTLMAPLILYSRHDPMPTGSPILPYFHNTRQGVGHNQNAGGEV